MDITTKEEKQGKYFNYNRKEVSTMTIKELIKKLKEYDQNTEVKLDYGGLIEEILDVYDVDTFVYIG